MNGTRLYNTAAVSRADRVEVPGAQPDSLAICEPTELGGSGGGWDPERLYAAALATCLHQSVVVIASAGGHDTNGCTVRAEVSLGESGAQIYDLEASLIVELPGITDADARQGLVDQAVHHCPLAGGWSVTVT